MVPVKAPCNFSFVDSGACKAKTGCDRHEAGLWAVL